MPTLRQPWVRLWVEALEHPKIALLSDSQYRTWTACLLRASQQPRRWTFQSVAQAAAVTGRPKAQVQALVGSLLDVQQDGTLRVHDWQIWQRSRPEDYVNDARSTHDQSVKHTGSERETSSYAREDKDKDKELTPAGSSRPGSTRVRARETAESPELLAEHLARIAQERASQAKPSQPSEKSSQDDEETHADG